jgi:hypothetical protein
MQPAVDQDTLARLLARGRAQGHLTTEDLRRALPVDAMQAEDLALVVAHLEDEGVPVEIDESLFLGGPDAAPPRAIELSPSPNSASTPAPPLRAAPSGAGPVPAPAAPPPTAAPSGPYAHRAVWIAGGLVFALLALALLVLPHLARAG